MLILGTFWLPCLAAMTELIAAPHFAKSRPDGEKLSEVFHKPSLGKLLGDHQQGKLDEICWQAA